MGLHEGTFLTGEYIFFKFIFDLYLGALVHRVRTKTSYIRYKWEGGGGDWAASISQMTNCYT